MRFALIIAAALTASAAFAAEEPPLSPYQWQQQQKVAFDESEKVYTEALKRNGISRSSRRCAMRIAAIRTTRSASCSAST